MFCCFPMWKGKMKKECKNIHSTLANEPHCDKTNKLSVRPTKTQINLGIRPVWSESSLCAQWVAKDPRFLHADSEDWSDWADAQADLSLRWAHTHFVGCHVAAHILNLPNVATVMVSNWYRCESPCSEEPQSYARKENIPERPGLGRWVWFFGYSSYVLI